MEYLHLFENTNEYILKLTQNYGDKERAMEEYNFYKDILDEYYSDGGEVYRIVFAKKESDIDINNLGKHWTFTTDAISRYYYNINSAAEDGKKPFIIKANALKKSVDFDLSWENFTQIPDECEINFKIQPILISIKPFKLK